MATIDENGKIRDGRDRKVDGTITKLESGRFIFNCSTCAEDFKYFEEIIGHIDSVHSNERHGNIGTMEPNSSNRKMEPIASTSTQYLMTTNLNETWTDPTLKSTSALPATSNKSHKRKGYTPFIDVMNEPNPISRYNSKVRLEMIIFDSNNGKKEQRKKRFIPYTKSTKKERDSKPKLNIDRTKLANVISRLNIVNRRKESIALVASELNLRLTDSDDRLWLANKMKSPIDKMNHQTSKKTSIKKEPIASISTSFNNFEGFTKKDSKNAILKHSNAFSNRLRLCRIKTEIDPTELCQVMRRYGINNCRKESVLFVAEKLNVTQSFRIEQLRTKMRTKISQTKFTFNSVASPANSTFKNEELEI